MTEVQGNDNVGNLALDEGVIAVLPSDSQVLEFHSSVKSAWTTTARIAVRLSDGSCKQYFLKCATEGGELMMEGEFKSMSELYKLAPSFVPRPHAWGKFQRANSLTHFFLCDFIDMKMELPDRVTFCERLASIHVNSQSPTGQFGFEIPNCHGKIVQANGWDPSWRSFFTKLLVSFLQIEIGVNGNWEEYEQAFEVIVKTVIPQLLDPLQAGGRTLKPCLVHGDLWEENAAVNRSTGDPIVFDASAFYAHNEYELGTWRRKTIKFNEFYLNEYQRNVQPSEPAEQWDDRIPRELRVKPDEMDKPEETDKPEEIDKSEEIDKPDEIDQPAEEAC
ncbi:MAG: hypothetical protein Q9224_005832 [Gallowayella concinna]